MLQTVHLHPRKPEYNVSLCAGSAIGIDWREMKEKNIGPYTKNLPDDASYLLQVVLAFSY